MRKVRLILLCVLCAGLLVCGIGAGVTLTEVSAFSYGGQQLLESAQLRSQSLCGWTDLEGHACDPAKPPAQRASLEMSAIGQKQVETIPRRIRPSNAPRCVANFQLGNALVGGANALKTPLRRSFLAGVVVFACKKRDLT